MAINLYKGVGWLGTHLPNNKENVGPWLKATQQNESIQFCNIITILKF